MPKFYDPNPPWPIACRKLDEKTCMVETRWAHNEKELDKFTKPENEGGMGYVTSVLAGVKWPKLMSHPGTDKPNVTVQNEQQQAKYEAQGYNFDHWENAQAKLARAEEQAAPPSFDPKAQARIDELEKKLNLALELQAAERAPLQAGIVQMQMGQTLPPKPKRGRPKRIKVEEPAEVA